MEESEISKIVPILFEKSMSFEDDGEFDEYQVMFFEMMEAILKQVIRLQWSVEQSAEIVFFNSISDDERTEEIEKHSAKNLNSKELFNKFIEEML